MRIGRCLALSGRVLLYRFLLEIPQLYGLIYINALNFIHNNIKQIQHFNINQVHSSILIMIWPEIYLNYHPKTPVSRYKEE